MTPQPSVKTDDGTGCSLLTCVRRQVFRVWISLDPWRRRSSLAPVFLEWLAFEDSWIFRNHGSSALPVLMPNVGAVFGNSLFLNKC
jgi:hypothetical protein